MPTSADRRRFITGLAFLSPNIIGFLAFTLIPLCFSLVLAFSNWDLKQHNIFHPHSHIHFIGFGNFIRLIHSPDFWRFFGNTIFFLMGLPVGIAASLGTAMLLSNDLTGGSRRIQICMVAGAVLLLSCCLLAGLGAGVSAMTVLLITMIGATLVLGTSVGNSVYRTMLYVPNFTSGIATFLLWKKIFNPQTGPINVALRSPLASLGNAVEGVPAWILEILASRGCLLLAILLCVWGVWTIHRWLRDADLGWLAAMFSVLFLFVPLLVTVGTNTTGVVCWLGCSIATFAVFAVASRPDGPRRCSAAEGAGNGVMLCGFLMTFEFLLVGFSIVLRHLPSMAAAGLQPPPWLTNYDWAKPSLMLMGFWGAIGSNTMLLYLAALTNVPQDLYEAADIDGASRFMKFWNVTWPQLSSTTFFVVVMGVIGGLQGGFESAKVMTGGGPAGSTTTLSYFIYNEGFATGRLGYSSAVAWTMFLMVLLITLFNWKLGSRYVND